MKQKKHFYFFILVLFASFATFAQTKVKGKVVDENGASVPGINVIEKTSKKGVSTDYSGEFSISLGDGSYTLVFQGIGFKKQEKSIVVKGGDTESIKISLATEINNLDEIVIKSASALGGPKRQLGNSITTIKAEEIRKTGTENLFGALQGKIPGAQITQNSGDPAGGFSIRLRGTKSLRGSSDPLYVIDGVIVSNASVNIAQLAAANQAGDATLGQNRLADINPNDVESLSVLNGAAAAAVYGSRASNGVVLITTKKGRSGETKFTFSSTAGINTLREKQFISTLGKQFGNAALRLHTVGGLTAPQITAWTPLGLTFIQVSRDGGAPANLATNIVDVTRYDYQDDIFRTAYSNDTYLSASGGNDKSQYFASLSYSNNEGIIKGTNFRRVGMRVRLNQNVTNWLKVAAGISYNNSLSNEKATGNVFYSPINSINITNNIYDLNVRDAQGNLQAVEISRVNPLSTIEDMDFQQTTNRTISDLQFNATPIKNMSIDWNVGVDFISQFGKNYIRPYPYNAIANLPPERYPNGFAANAGNTSVLLNSDFSIKYKFNLADKLDLSLIGGFNNQYQKAELLAASGNTLTPSVTTINGAASTTITAGYGLDQFSVYGQYLQGTFGYDNRYFVTAALRRDGASMFSPNENNQYYPKVSTSLVLVDNAQGAINLAKLRSSWGQAGGLTALGTYDRFYQFTSPAFLGVSTLVPGARLANPNVAPEITTEIEVGGDFTFFNNIVNLGVSYYEQKITDLIVNRTLASTSGGTSIVNNFGGMENKGYEISLGLNLIKKKNLSWDADIIFSQNRNKITDLAGGTTSFIANSGGAPIALIQGEAASVFYGTYYARNADGSLLLTAQGLPQSDKVGRDVNGQPVGVALLKVIGDPNPDWMGSFRTSITYKNFTFKTMFDAVIGQDVFNADRRTRNNVGFGKLAEQELTGQIPRGTIYSLVPIEEYRVEDGSFVKVREIGFSYRFNEPWMKKTDLTLSVTGRNLFVITKYEGYDPETNAGGNSSLLRGVDFGNVPIPRTVQFSATYNF